MSQGKNAKIANWTVTKMGPTIKDPDVVALLPTTFRGVKVSVELSGVNIGIANAIRRVLSGGIPVICMDFEPNALKTNDEFVLVDLLRRRINLIPIRQDLDPAITFSLHAANTTEALVTIKSSSIEPSKRTPNTFNHSFDIIDLHPTKALTIDKISIIRGYGTEDARHVAVFRTALVPLDQIPFDQFSGEGVPSALSDPRHHRLTFHTNGNIDPKAAVDSACVELLAIVERGRKSIPSLQTRDLLTSISFEGATDTLGNMLLKTAYDIYPSGADFRYNVDELGNKISFELRTSEDPAVVLGAIFSEIRATFEKLRAQFKAIVSAH